MTQSNKTLTPAEFDACCAAAGISLEPRHKAAVFATAQWLAAGLAKLRETYPDTGKTQP